MNLEKELSMKITLKAQFCIRTLYTILMKILAIFKASKSIHNRNDFYRYFPNCVLSACVKDSKVAN